MSFLKKLFGKQDDHEAWLEKHPGKGKPSTPPPLVSEADAQGMRDRMEAELDGQRTKRENT